MNPETELLDRAVKGDTCALEKLLEQHLPDLRTWLCGKISSVWRSKFDEDDVVQVTCLEAFLYVGRFSPTREGSFVTWLRKIAENNLRDAIAALEAEKRPNPRRQMQPVIAEESYLSLFEQLGAATTTPSQRAARREAKEALEQAISLLPRDYRGAVLQYDIEGRSVGDVAAALGRSVGAVFMLRARAHDRLRELLGTASRLF